MLLSKGPQSTFAALTGALTIAAMLATMPPAFADGPITLWYQRGGTPEQQRILQKDLVGPFNAAHPTSPLTLDVRASGNGDKQIRMAVISGKGPDIVMTPGPSTTLALVQSDHLLPLDDYIKKYNLDKRILAPVLKTGEYKGHNYALPRTFETMVLYYNKTLFDKNGWTPPKTMAELNTIAEAMQAKNITPFSVGNGDWRAANEWHVTVVLNHYAGPENIYKALKGEIPWTDPVFVQAIDVLKNWYQKGWFGKNYFSLTGDQEALLLAKGEAGMAPNGTFSFDSMVAAFKQTGQELGVAAFPSLRDGVPYPIYAIGTGSTMSINKNSANPDGAGAFLDYLYSDSFYDLISKDWPGDWNLPLTSIDEAKLSKNVSPLFAATVTSFSKAVAQGNFGYTTWTFWPPATEDYLIHGIEQVWLGQISTDDYLKKMQETFAKEMADGKVPPLAAR
ncbi:ABC transporter substrate-binding protein [Methylocapsa sp. S129]|uniref:ABC transporter substrate-binding protein n=1 Tax=Methylocapsa sp. S129 TaxID=1641869 RepID=UPI00131B0673|nr:extracellular solute-binding protein [Methylocapsa sp. S129]